MDFGNCFYQRECNELSILLIPQALFMKRGAMYVCMYIFIDCKLHYKISIQKNYNNNEHIEITLLMAKDINCTIKYLQSMKKLILWYTTMLRQTFHVC